VTRRPFLRRYAVPLALVVVAAAVRVVSYLEIRDTPLLHLHAWTETDMHFYDRWAQRIAGGDLLTSTRMRPYHTGHAAVARQAHAILGIPRPFDERVGEALWDAWLGERTFYQDPLYAYVVAAVYAVFGRSIPAVVFVQGLMGLGIVALVYILTLRLFGPREAALAGLAAALYAPLVYYEALLVKPVLIALTGLASVVLVVRALERPASAARCLAAGLGCGLAFLAQSSAVLFVAPAAAILAMRARRDGLAPWRSAGLCLAGVAVALLPVVARNAAVGAPPLVFNATGGWTFMNHNAEDYRAESGDTVTTHAGEILVRTGGRLLPTVVETLRTHERFTDWVRLLAAKAATFWHWYEMPNNSSFEYYRTQQPLARALPTFALVAPLALLGLVRGFRRSADAAVAALHVVAGIATLLVFYQISRLRFPIAIGMLPFAAYGLTSLAEDARERRWTRFGLSVGVTVLLLAAILRPLPPGIPVLRLADYGVPNEIAGHLAQRKAGAGDVAGALATLERQLALEPPALRDLDPDAGSARLTPLEAQLAGSFSAVHAQAAELCGRLGRAEDARAHHRRAQVLSLIGRRAR
jgi:4-amino-4-deoxy-L-arabinose transferase-like glycosyltransferase